MLRSIVLFALGFSIPAHADLAAIADFYDQRYQVRSVLEDYVKNDNLASMKRMKQALNGVLFWGGTAYGQKEMGEDGLRGLCEEGFSSAIYVYKAKRRLSGTSCSNGQTDYLNILYSSKSNYSALKGYLQLVKERVDNPDAGPIYLHCWNGIHASSQMAAIAMIQFCGISDEQAVKVFRENSNGTWKSYPHVANGITNFKPYSDISITPEQQRIVCQTAWSSL